MMEGIVFGIAQISFQQSLGKVTDENSGNISHERFKKSSTNMTSEHLLLIPEQLESICVHENNEPWQNSSKTTVEGDDGRRESEDIDSESSISKNRSRKSCTYADLRQLPTRASKETSMLGIKRRTIMKPTKRKQAIHKDFNSLKPADIKKIYLNKKITNFKPSSLETIFEEPLITQNDLDEHDNVRLIGARKIKRSLYCSDGHKHNKTLVNKRRAKIKKTFGRRFALKKISLEEFLDKFNSNMEENEASTNLSEGLWINKSSSDHEAILSDTSTSTNGTSTAAAGMMTSLLL